MCLKLIFPLQENALKDSRPSFNQWLNSKTQEMQKIAELKKKQEELKKLEIERRNNRKSISDSVYNAWLKSKDEAQKNKSKDTKNVAKPKKGRSKSFEGDFNILVEK